MKFLCCTLVALVFLAALLCAFERPAYAYVDPGSGLLAYQSLGALVAGVMYHFRRRIRSLLRSRAGS